MIHRASVAPRHVVEDRLPHAPGSAFPSGRTVEGECDAEAQSSGPGDCERFPLGMSGVVPVLDSPRERFRDAPCYQAIGPVFCCRAGRCTRHLRGRKARSGRLARRHHASDPCSRVNCTVLFGHADPVDEF
jgi:hypothetical protein